MVTYYLYNFPQNPSQYYTLMFWFQNSGTARHFHLYGLQKLHLLILVQNALGMSRPRIHLETPLLIDQVPYQQPISVSGNWSHQQFGLSQFFHRNSTFHANDNRRWMLALPFWIRLRTSFDFEEGQVWSIRRCSNVISLYINIILLFLANINRYSFHICNL